MLRCFGANYFSLFSTIVQVSFDSTGKLKTDLSTSSQIIKTRPYYGPGVITGNTEKSILGSIFK